MKNVIRDALNTVFEHVFEQDLEKFITFQCVPSLN